MSYPEHPGGVSRRNLIKSSAIGSLALAAGGLSLPRRGRRRAASHRSRRKNRMGGLLG